MRITTLDTKASHSRDKHLFSEGITMVERQVLMTGL